MLPTLVRTEGNKDRVSVILTRPNWGHSFTVFVALLPVGKVVVKDVKSGKIFFPKILGTINSFYGLGYKILSVFSYFYFFSTCVTASITFF